jgi:WD40 repeat protein
MPRLQLLIEAAGSGSTRTSIPVQIADEMTIGAFVSSFVDRLYLPKKDSAGTPLAYRLRFASEEMPLAAERRFADLRIPPGTHFVLEADVAHAPTLPGTIVPQSLRASHHWSRRSVLVTGAVLFVSAAAGLGTGFTTALAQRYSLLRRPTPPPHSAIAVPTEPSVPAAFTLLPHLTFAGHQQTVRTVAWSPEGTMLASGADDAQLLLWTPDGTIRHHVPHPAPVQALAWSPRGQRVVTGAANQVLFLDASTGTALTQARHAHEASVTSLAWSSHAGHPVVSGSLDRRAIVWNTQVYQPLTVFRRHMTPIEAIACMTQDAIVASASQGGVVRLWQLETAQEVHGFYKGDQFPLHAIAWTPGGMQLTVGGDDGNIQVWSNPLLCHQSVAVLAEIQCADTPQRSRAHAAAVRALAWSPDGRFLATGGDDGILAIWDASAGFSLLSTTQHDAPVLALAWAPDQRYLATASGRAVMIWRVQA